MQYTHPAVEGLTYTYFDKTPPNSNGIARGAGYYFESYVWKFINYSFVRVFTWNKSPMKRGFIEKIE